MHFHRYNAKCGSLVDGLKFQCKSSVVVARRRRAVVARRRRAVVACRRRSAPCKPTLVKGISKLLASRAQAAPYRAALTSKMRRWAVCKLRDGQIDGKGHGGRIENSKQKGYNCSISCAPTVTIARRRRAVVARRRRVVVARRRRAVVARRRCVVVARRRRAVVARRRRVVVARRRHAVVVRRRRAVVARRRRAVVARRRRAVGARRRRKRGTEGRKRWCQNLVAGTIVP